mmetsp:Transcript_85029/g.170154  ORF Transcript_85029/g.170154 Transcript_85029/m.170154 type:complete len:398 (-) Transcript_85029:283-1476(-)
MALQLWPGLTLLIFTLKASSTFSQDVFAVTGEANCAELLKFEECLVPLTKDSDPCFCMNYKDDVHESFFQEFWVNDELQFTIDWAFTTGPKTLEQRFLDAQNTGEQVIWSVVTAPGKSWNGVTAETHSGVWHFSSNAYLGDAFGGAISGLGTVKGNGFSYDDGSWGAAFHDGVTPVNGDLPAGTVRTGWGHENHQSTDIATCKFWYANGNRNECGDLDTIRSVMKIIQPQGTCFHRDTLVTLMDGTNKVIAEVRVGDKIQTADIHGKLDFAPIISLPHLVGNNETAKFLTLTLESGKALRLTPGHLMPTCGGMTLPASELVVGDCLMTVDGKETLFEVSKAATDYGIYTAVTQHTFIVTNGIVASPFSIENVKERPEHKRASFVGFAKKLASKAGLI